ncbi:hypothetical protein [uncultured Clostridium sp.]|uniref:hypothetical protein n=1 Tax=uncultured Clostridium sp. TaxID=59620 RepID=UPI002612CC91|nr:hypothetical protein [uncultured Clostridium sp.]
MTGTRILIISSNDLKEFEQKLIDTNTEHDIVDVDENKICKTYVARVTIQI